MKEEENASQLASVAGGRPKGCYLPGTRALNVPYLANVGCSDQERARNQSGTGSRSQCRPEHHLAKNN